MATYNELLKNALPEQYGKLQQLMSYTANEQYGGVPQDWQAQIFTPLDVKNLNIKKKIDATPARIATMQGSEGDITYRAPAQLNESGYHPLYSRSAESASDFVDGYVSDTPEIVNGVPVYGNYNLNGELMYYSGDPGVRNWLNGNESVSGQWDASGKPNPRTYSSSGGGFLGGVVSGIGGAVGEFGNMLDKAVRDNLPGGWTIPALVAAAYAGGAFDPATASATTGSTAGAAGATTTAGAAGTTGGVLSNAALDAQFIAADAAQLSAQGLGASQIAATLEASGVSAMVAANAAQLAAQGLGASQIASTITQGMPTATAATGGAGLFTGAGAAGAATAAGTAATGAAGALTASEAAKAALIQGGLGLAGGLLQGDTTKDAMEADAAARAKLAAEVRDMGKFQPVGTTTRFGTSSFTTDPTTGAITPSYSLSPEALAYQNSLSALGTQGLAGGQTMMNLGQQYVGESPEAVRQRYMATQNALLAPQQEQALAGIRTNLMNTGRQGLAYGATDAGGMGATNPELAAYYNSLATQQRQLAADAETQYQNQVNFGTGLMGSATTPFTNVFTAQKAVEAAGQQPLQMSTDFANTVATRGAAQGANYAAAMSPSLQSSYNAANYNPWATAIQGAASNPLVGYGLMQAWK